MIIKGLDTLMAHLDELERQQDEHEWEEFTRNIEESIARLEMEGMDHIEAAWFDPACWYYIFHVDANNKIVAVMGSDDNSQRAWGMAQEYVSADGLTFNELMGNNRAFTARADAAWREKFPEEAAEYDRRQAAIAEGERLGLDQW